jgi:hypothetical protein
LSPPELRFFDLVLVSESDVPTDSSLSPDRVVAINRVASRMVLLAKTVSRLPQFRRRFNAVVRAVARAPHGADATAQAVVSE